MLTVGDLMTEDLVTVGPQYTLREAAEAMADEHVSGVPVVEDGMAVGVVSATDLMAFAADASGRSAGGGVGGAARRRATEVPSGYYTEQWPAEPADPGQLVGDTDRPEWSALEEHTVGELMSRALITLSPEASLQEAAGAMLNAGVRRLLVIDVDRLVGLVSATDVLGAVADHGVGA